jgi:hypothetical protein
MKKINDIRQDRLMKDDKGDLWQFLHGAMRAAQAAFGR